MFPNVVLWVISASAIFAAIFFGAGFFRLNKQKGERTIIDAIDKEDHTVYIIIDSEKKIPLYISDNITNILGLEKETADSDIFSLEWCVEGNTRRNFHRDIKNHDFKEDYISEFEFFNIETHEQHYGRVFISKHSNGTAIIRIDEITEEMRKRSELLEEIERVKTEEEQKSDFLSKMSHEIRTPMNGILGMITLAKNNINDAQEVMNYMNKAQGLSQFLISLINDILDMSKIESGKVELEHEKFDLLEIYDKIEEMFRISVEDKGINFVMEHIDMDVRYVEGDSLRLMQTLTNFVSNANKYTSKGGTISITFRQMSKAEGKVHILFKIKDTGKGMDPEFLSRIFKPFVQESASTARNFGGTGLGMAIADNLVRLMGGHIVVDTALGKGSEFSVYIPFDIADGDQSMEDNQTVKAIEQDNEISLEGLKILMAEDNAINAEIAVEILSLDGIDVEVAENGRIAVEMFENNPDGYYDVILMDIQMPELNGWEAAEKIRAMDSGYAKSIPIFALSANAFVEDKRYSLKVGMNGHISKPIDFADLKVVINESLTVSKG